MSALDEIRLDIAKRTGCDGSEAPLSNGQSLMDAVKNGYKFEKQDDDNEDDEDKEQGSPKGITPWKPF